MITLVESAARTTNGQGSTVGAFADVDSAVVHVVVTAAGGVSPTLTVAIEETVDGVNWVQVAATAALTGVGVTRLTLPQPFAGAVRARWTIGGTTPSFTFSVVADGRRTG